MSAEPRPTRTPLKTFLHVVAIAVTGIAMTYGVGLATKAHLLVPLAAPLGIGLVLAMCWLPRRTQLIGWSVLTVWLLSTVYLGSGALEPVALVVVVVLSLAAVLRSPWFLVAVWALHPVWDLAVPRVLPEARHDLPLGCLIYDLVVAAYLVWWTVRASRRR